MGYCRASHEDMLSLSVALVSSIHSLRMALLPNGPIRGEGREEERPSEVCAIPIPTSLGLLA